MTRTRRFGGTLATILSVCSIAVLSSAMAGTAVAGGTPKSNWTALNAALAPVNVALQTDVELLALSFADVNQDTQDVFFGSPFDMTAMNKHIQKLKDDEAKLGKALADIQKDARAGIAALDSFAPEACSAHFTGSEYAYFAAWDESASALSGGQGTHAISAAIYLGGLSDVDLTRLPAGGPIDIEWTHVKCAGSPPNPHPTASPSPVPSGGAKP